MANYRCYFYDNADRIGRVEVVPVMSDTEAIDIAMKLFELLGYVVFELWAGNEMILRHPARKIDPAEGLISHHYRAA